MDVREKLVELISQVQSYGVKQGNHITHQEGKTNREIASHLIAHGVTVQEWISVNDERKPKVGEDVIVVVFDGYDTYTDTDCLMRDGKWCFETENHKVTHWQPMPQPTEGE